MSAEFLSLSVVVVVKGNSDEECCVDHQGQCSDAAPVNGRQSNRRIIAKKGNQQKSKPDGNAAQQASQKPLLLP